MDFSHYSDETVALAVDLVNTLEAFSDSESLEGPEDVERFLDEHAPGWPRRPHSLTDADLHEVRAIRSRLRSVFGSAGAAEAAERLNGILDDVAATPRVSTHGGRPHLHFEPADAGVAGWLGAVTAMGLTVALIEGGIERMGICESSTCDDVFVDTSRNRSRRHCSDTCTTRENVAAYRRRRRAT